MATLTTALAPERMVDLRSTDKPAILEELVSVLAPLEPALDARAVLKAVLDREALSSTGIGEGLAMPHARLPSLKHFVLALGRTREPVDFDSIDGVPVRLILLLAGPESKDRQPDYLRLLRKGSQFLRAERERLLAAPDLREAYAVCLEY